MSEWYRMSVDALKDYNKKRLAQLAKDKGIPGWHAMRKDQLIRALSRARKAASRSSSPKQRQAATAPHVGPRKKKPIKNPLLANGRKHSGARGGQSAPAASGQPLDHDCQKDRIIVLTRDSFWLHAYWELSRTTLARARAALGQDWHGARPILRVMDVSSDDTTSAVEQHVRDIRIHGGVNNWYIDVVEPPRSYRIDIGYLSRNGKFYVLARSNVVTTPRAGVTDALDENWANVQKQFDRIEHGSSNGNGSVSHDHVLDLRDLFEERLRRPMNSAALQDLATSALARWGATSISRSMPS